MVFLLALIPWVVFLVSVPVGALFTDYQSVDVPDFLSSALFYVGFVSLPSLLPIAVARAGPTRVAATAVMSIVAGVSGVLIATTDDAQAGLAVLIVAYVAIPLAVILWIAKLVMRRGEARSDVTTQLPD